MGCASKELSKNPAVLDFNNETMSLIQGGEFMMGDYEDPFNDKMPRIVRVNNFYIDRTEVTNGTYRAYMDERLAINKAVQTPRYINDPQLGADLLPVVGVSHEEAQTFCKHYTKRLPTEAEWEYAARGGYERKKYPWGTNKADKSMMNYRDSNSSWASNIMTYMPNEYFLFDMTGNVREWVLDSYEKDFYKQACLTSPFLIGLDEVDIDLVLKVASDFSMESIYKSNCYLDPVNLVETKWKVNRGGSWEYSEGYPATVSFRTFDDENARKRDLGFRCAASTEKDSWLNMKIKEFLGE